MRRWALLAAAYTLGLVGGSAPRAGAAVIVLLIGVWGLRFPWRFVRLLARAVATVGSQRDEGGTA